MQGLSIQAGEIHIWHADQADFSLTELKTDCLAWLTENERQRFQRYQFDKHRKQLLLGKVLQRVVLSRYVPSMAPASWEFSQNDYGKPAVSKEQNADAIYFNLTHSAERAVLAVARVEDVGVDIEFSNRPRQIEAIAQRYFSEQECKEILALEESRQQDRFYDLWTLKEAYIKACGMGLAIPLQHFSYVFSEKNKLVIEFDDRRNDSPEDWQLWQLDGGVDYKLALAVRVAAGERIEKISTRQLSAIDQFSERSTQIVRSN